jgi:three-Cys-motif partner protein
MGHENHLWRIGSPPPLIRPHSLAKHRVLRAYLEKYVSVLTANPKQETMRLTLVDGFAGGGKYLDSRTKEERPGSPLIMLEAMKAAESVFGN